MFQRMRADSIDDRGGTRGAHGCFDLIDIPTKAVRAEDRSRDVSSGECGRM